MNEAYPVTIFSLLASEHLPQILTWRNLPRIRQNMYSQEVISLVQHKQWFENLSQDPARRFFVMSQNGKPIGCLNFSEMQLPEWEWGCYIGENAVWPGSGILLEIAALDFAAAHGAQQLRAEVLDFNFPPIKLHRFFAYQQLDNKAAVVERDGVAHDALVFRYVMDDWRVARAGILAKLPKQVAAAAGNIQFIFNET